MTFESRSRGAFSVAGLCNDAAGLPAALAELATKLGDVRFLSKTETNGLPQRFIGGLPPMPEPSFVSILW
jgi:hypothetical protein